MWKRLFYEGYEIEAKVYETGSEYGIDGGPATDDDRYVEEESEDMTLKLTQ